MLDLDFIPNHSQARLKNSLLRIQYPAEPVTWISNLDLTFGQLINADEASVLKLARYLGLSPSQEEDHLNVLNAVMRHLGVSCMHSTSSAKNSRNDHGHT